MADAAVLEARVARRAPKSPELQSVERLESELAAKQAEVERFVQELAEVENPRQAAVNRQKKAEERFARAGGVHWEQRQVRERRLGELKHAQEETEQRLIALAATELPLTLVPDLLAAVLQQANLERQTDDARVIQRLLSERDELLLRQLQGKRLGERALKSVRELLDQDRAERSAAPQVEPRLHLSDFERRLLEHLLERGLAERRELAAQLVTQLDRTRRELEDTHRSLAATPNDESVREVAEELKAATTEVESRTAQVRRLEKELDSVRFERDELEKQLSRLRRKVVDEELRGEEDVRLAGLLSRTQATMREFLHRATATKIDRLSERVTESFRFLLRKQSLIERVAIDPATFAITLYDAAGQTVPKQRLSEGEKQIFAISVLWGLSRCSARPLPAIIDTPMARLDVKHRDQLVERYFPHASHQVIVLSTDTEIECHYFEQLQPHIARAYHLNYDEATRATTAEEGYFWEWVQ